MNGDAAVLDVNGQPIPGLYPAGSTIGGLNGGPNSGYVGGLINALKVVGKGGKSAFVAGSRWQKFLREYVGGMKAGIWNDVLQPVMLFGGAGLILVGGEFRPTSRAFVGPLTRHLLENVHVAKALVGTYALSLDEGLSTTDASEAFTKALVLERATEVIVLADSRKLGATSFARAGRLDQVDVLVTDDGIDDHVARRLAKLGITVITA